MEVSCGLEAPADLVSKKEVPVSIKWGTSWALRRGLDALENRKIHYCGWESNCYYRGFQLMIIETVRKIVLI